MTTDWLEKFLQTEYEPIDAIEGRKYFYGQIPYLRSNLKQFLKEMAADIEARTRKATVAECVEALPNMTHPLGDFENRTFTCGRNVCIQDTQKALQSLIDEE